MKDFLTIDTSMKVLIFEPIKAPIIEISEITIRKSYSIDILFKNISVLKPNKLLQVINIRDVPIASLNFNLEKIVKVGTIKNHHLHQQVLLSSQQLSP